MLPALRGRAGLTLLAAVPILLASLDFFVIFEVAHSLNFLAENFGSVTSFSSTSECCRFCSWREVAERREASFALIPIVGSLLRRSRPSACPSEFLRVRVRCFGAISLNVVLRCIMADSDAGRSILSVERLFSHSPSFSVLFLVLMKSSSEGDARSWVLVGEGNRAIRAEGGLDAPRLNIEEMLLLTEWSRMVENELSVSEDMVDKGLGMYSTSVANPTTLGRADSSTTACSAGEPNGSDMPVAGFTTSLGGSIRSAGCSSGVLGKLLDRRGCKSVGACMSFATSLLDIAAERLCACPRRPGTVLGPVAPKSGSALALVGLELKALCTPILESPPTNSLPPRRWPLRPGVAGLISSDVLGGESSPCLPDASVALKEKLGSVDTVRR